MRSSRRALYALWALTAVLILAGVLAGRGRGAAQPHTGGSDTVWIAAAAGLQVPADTVGSAAAGQVDSLAPARTLPAQTDSGPPASGVGSAQPPIETQPQQGQAGQALRQAMSDIDTPFSARLVSLLGMFVLLTIGWLLSTDRRLVPWRVLAWGIGLQLIFAVLILKTPAGRAVFSAINTVVVQLLGFTETGARFLFGNLVLNNVPVGTGAPGNAPISVLPESVANTGAYFAFSVLPTIIFFSSLMTLLYHLGVMQAVVKGVAWLMMRTMRTSGAETLSAAGNIFVGQTEAPLLIKPYVRDMTLSELHAVMTGGFATVAGGVMAAYVGMLLFYFPDIAGHLMAASVMSAPAALVFAKLMLPEKEIPKTRDTLHVQVEKIDANVIDAAARGAGEGLQLALNVGAMLLAFIALVALLNAIIGGIAGITGLTALLHGAEVLPADQPLNLEWILGRVLAPLAWVMGVPWRDAAEVGSLIGVKTVLNEFVAYLQLSSLLTGGADLSPRSVIIATYALCGFANFSSIAIQIGGIGGLAPTRRSDLARIGLRAMIAGTLAAFMTATIAGMIV
jgi:CNT family concentrative nucleoside transporter